MTMIASYSWENDTWTHHNGENPTRKIWREVVSEIGEKAKAALPECNGRVDSAIKIVLNGDVELLENGKAKVSSQSNGTTEYFVVNGSCNCKDFPKAPTYRKFKRPFPPTSSLPACALPLPPHALADAAPARQARGAGTDRLKRIL